VAPVNEILLLCQRRVAGLKEGSPDIIPVRTWLEGKRKCALPSRTIIFDKTTEYPSHDPRSWIVLAAPNPGTVKSSSMVAMLIGGDRISDERSQ
jgi:hypothetical protein